MNLKRKSVKPVPKIRPNPTRKEALPKEMSSPKTTRPVAADRRGKDGDRKTLSKRGRTFDAFPDRVDVRDWIYRPTLNPLPGEISDLTRIPSILNQHNEGACTGFALAGVLNLLLLARRVKRTVSAWMLYEMARRYDEWPGQKYSGSSARGAIKGFIHHGVCSEANWKNNHKGLKAFNQRIATDASGTPGGAYYRVQHKEIRDVHAAISEVGAVFATLMVHAGWDEPGPSQAKLSGKLSRKVPIIERRGRSEEGHAVALVGYTGQGFLVQNSWGESWGEKGVALLPYEDYLLHATDVWVVQLGVPIKMEVWQDEEARDTSAGLQRAAAAVPLTSIRPYVIDVGNNGGLSDSGKYWTTEGDLKELFRKTIPEACKGWKKRRVMLYLHGGLNDESDVSKRIIAYREVMLANEIYPLHIMWETGLRETITSALGDLFTRDDNRAGAGRQWFDKYRDGLIEAKDQCLEFTWSLPGQGLWKEMKENARLASSRSDEQGAMQRVAFHVQKAIQEIGKGGTGGIELHVVAHSAGSIFTAYALDALTKLGLPLKSIQFMAPAITTELFKDTILRMVDKGKCPHPTLYLLSDVGERDDTVGPYGKSLLYLVSNSFEGRRGVPLLGMEKYVSDLGEVKGKYADPDLVTFFRKQVEGLPSLVVAGKAQGDTVPSRSDTHGGFDNDPDTMNSVLRRILGKEADRKFETRDLQF